MARPKVSKNIKRLVTIEKINQLMEEKKTQIEALLDEIRVEGENTLGSDLRKKKTTLRSLEKSIKFEQGGER